MTVDLPVPAGQDTPPSSYLPDGTWCCVLEHRKTPCGDCGGCRHVQAVNRAGRETPPADAITEAMVEAAHAYDLAHRRDERRPTWTVWTHPTDAQVRRLLTGAMPAIRAQVAEAERAAIYDELRHDHFVIFAPDGWTTEHSIECRLSGHMHECAYHARIAGFANERGHVMLGRWRIDSFGRDDVPSLTRAELIGGAS